MFFNRISEDAENNAQGKLFMDLLNAGSLYVLMVGPLVTSLENTLATNTMAVQLWIILYWKLVFSM